MTDDDNTHAKQARRLEAQILGAGESIKPRCPRLSASRHVTADDWAEIDDALGELLRSRGALPDLTIKLCALAVASCEPTGDTRESWALHALARICHVVSRPGFTMHDPEQFPEPDRDP